MKQILLAMAAALTAAANELEPAETGAPAGGGTGTEEPTKRRGRPPGSTNAPAAPAAGVKTYEELRELIKPLVEGGEGENVKKVIAKYGSSLKDIPADKQAAFVKDIEAMSY